jgi:hypothetical protein
MPDTPFPHLSDELIGELNRRYPERTPETDWSDRDIWIRVGERRVVRFLNEMFARQQENLLENL